MKSCPHCFTPAGPDWDHRTDCLHWPGSEWARRHGYMGHCGGLVYCLNVHPYEPHDLCGCEGQCHYCSHVGCERCIDKALADRPWWRKLLNLEEPGLLRRHQRVKDRP